MATPEQPEVPSKTVAVSPRADDNLPSGPAPNWRSQLGLMEHAVLAVGWLSCVVLAWVPLVVAVLLIGLVVVSMLASYSLLRIGGFAATDQRFLRWCVFGLLSAAVVVALLRRVFRPAG